MDTRIIDSSTTSHYDELTDTLHIKRVQDVEPILIQNQEEAKEFTRYGDMGKIASIPMVLVEKWINEEGVNILKPGAEEFLARKLMDPDYMNLRTVPKIGL